MLLLHEFQNCTTFLMFIMSKVMAFIDIKRDLVQWKFLLLNIAKNLHVRGGTVMSLQKLNGNKIYIKGAIISEIDNIIDDLYTHHLN